MGYLCGGGRGSVGRGQLTQRKCRKTNSLLMMAPRSRGPPAEPGSATHIPPTARCIWKPPRSLFEKQVCLDVIAYRFWERPWNLQHPSAWRLIFDGVTLPNGATITIVLVTFTDTSGRIVVHVVGCTSGPRSDGATVGNAVAGLLEETLKINSRQVDVLSTPSLPACRRPEREYLRRGRWLVCIPCDRAFCGRTGNAADAFVGKHLGVRGFCVKPSRAMCCFRPNRSCSQSLASCDGCLVGRPAYGSLSGLSVPGRSFKPMCSRA